MQGLGFRVLSPPVLAWPLMWGPMRPSLLRGGVHGEHPKTPTSEQSPQQFRV